MLQAVCETAQEVLLDRTFCALDKKSYQHFTHLTVMLNIAKLPAELCALLTT